MKKSSITKPQFGKIFIVRFLAMCLITFILSAFALEWLDSFLEDKRSESRNAYRNRIEEKAKELSKAEQGSPEYENILSELELDLFIYQMTDDNYAEVTVGGKKLATDKDTAFIRYNLKKPYEFLHVEDMSCFGPLYEFMNGKYNPKATSDLYAKYQWDPFFVHTYGERFDSIIYYVKSAYINHENHTFIPRHITIEDNEKKYDLDLGQRELSGYEYVESENGRGFGMIFSYRMDPRLSAEDIVQYAIPDADNKVAYRVEYEDYENVSKSRELPWHVGYTYPVSYSVYNLAPYTCVFIMGVAILSAMAVALLMAFIKYQKDKTVWNIFEYRTKTTEAMAHDLKTPMAAISAYAESLEDFAGDPVKTAEYSRKISEKIRTMDHMVEDILMLSKGETGKVEVKREDVSVLELVNESLKAFPSMMTEVKGDDVKLKTDRKLFKQAVDNLLSNSDRYAVEGSTVEITIAPESLTISNKSERTYEDVESLKKAFVKGDDSRSDRGTGLGLSIADNNLNILGYKLELKSADGVFEAKIRF